VPRGCGVPQTPATRPLSFVVRRREWEAIGPKGSRADAMENLSSLALRDRRRDRSRYPSVPLGADMAERQDRLWCLPRLPRHSVDRRLSFGTSLASALAGLRCLRLVLAYSGTAALSRHGPRCVRVEFDYFLDPWGGLWSFVCPRITSPSRYERGIMKAGASGEKKGTEIISILLGSDWAKSPRSRCNYLRPLFRADRGGLGRLTIWTTRA
jgi:hypothetical protein